MLMVPKYHLGQEVNGKQTAKLGHTSGLPATVIRLQMTLGGNKILIKVTTSSAKEINSLSNYFIHGITQTAGGRNGQMHLPMEKLRQKRDTYSSGWGVSMKCS